MKKNAGIKLSSNESINKYSNLYLESFNDCEIYASWAPFDAVYKAIKEAHETLNILFKEKETIYAEAVDIYHYIYGRPWTFALKNKRILIVSNFEESIKEKIEDEVKEIVVESVSLSTKIKLFFKKLFKKK